MRHAREDYDRFQDPAGIIPDDEPVFLIRGQDAVGWAAVEAYANLARAAGADSELVFRCETHADAMRKWARAHGKVPDLQTTPASP